MWDDLPTTERFSVRDLEPDYVEMLAQLEYDYWVRWSTSWEGLGAHDDRQNTTLLVSLIKRLRSSAPSEGTHTDR